MQAHGSLSQRFPKGSRLVLLHPGIANSAPTNLTEGFFAAADPQLNFQGDRVLFSGRKNEAEPWQLWEMDLTGANKHQITHCVTDCLRGAYVPADEIALTVEESQGKGHKSYLAVVKADGSQLRRITFAPVDFQLETVLRDGRIVASAPWPLEEDTASRTLYTLRPDGTALESFRCDHGQSNSAGDAAELDDGTLVFIRAPHNRVAKGGELMLTPRGAAAATPLGNRQTIYESPRQFTPDELLVSKAAVSGNAQARFDLCTVNTKTGLPGARVFADAHLSSIQAVPVAPHEVPKHYWSTLNPESSAGYFISLNSYLSADVPHGRLSPAIANVRVFTLNAADGKERSLGEAPVERDGSFYVQVPANTPVRFVLLDAAGKPIREERGWVWTRPGEERGCAGCHGGKNIAPDNHWPMTLKRFDTPTLLGDTEHGPATATAK